MNKQEQQDYLEQYKKDKEKGIPFFPDALFKDAVIALLVFLVLVGLAIFLGAPLEARANPADTEYTPRPEWYYLFLFQLLKYFPGNLEVDGVFIIPTPILDLVNARVADLDDADRNLLDVASCCGFEFDAGLVGDALGMARVPVLQAMAKIEKRHRLVRASVRVFVFDHHQVREALYGALPDPLREEYHAALGDALERRTGAAAKDPEELDGAVSVDLAEHFLEGARGARALRYVEAAVSHLQRAYRYAEAIRIEELALAHPTPPFAVTAAGPALPRDPSVEAAPRARSTARMRVSRSRCHE